MKKLQIILLLIAGILVPAIFGLVLFFILKSAKVVDIFLLKWAAFFVSFIGYYVAGVINKNTKTYLLPLLLIGLIPFSFFPFFYFPNAVLIILFAIIGLLLSRREIKNKIKLPIALTSILFITFHLFNQPLVIATKPGVNKYNEVFFKKVLWNFNSKTPPKVNNQVFIDTEGNKVRLSDYGGKNLYVSFWATSCGPCIVNKPILKEVIQNYEGQNDIVFIDISVDRNTETWKKFLINNESKNIQLLSPNWKATYQNFQMNGIPKYIFVDKDGNYRNAPAPKYLDEFLASDVSIEQFIRERH